MKKFIVTFALTFLLCSSAQAYTVLFDPTGSGTNSNLQNTASMQLNNRAEEIMLPDGTFEPGAVFTFQNIISGIFEEEFTVSVAYGNDADGLTQHSYTSIFMDIRLEGKYNSDTNIVFTGGAATMYRDANGDYDYNDGDDEIAVFAFSSALVSQLSGSLLGDLGNLGMKIDFAFKFDSLDEDYWGDKEIDLVDKEWLFSVVGGRIDQEALWVDPDNGEYIIKWQFPGAQMEFSAIPEPATMLLFGLGLLGLAGTSRKKFNK